MGDITPIVNGVRQAISIGNTINDVVGMARQFSGDTRDQAKAQQLAVQQLQAQQKLEQAQAAQQAEQERQKLEQEAAAATRERQQALEKAQAHQRALFASRGLGSETGGSGEAVLSGLQSDADAEAQDASSILNLKQQALDLSLAQQRQRDLLDVAQLQERNRQNSKSIFG